MDEMLSVKVPSQTQWWQLYVNADRELTRKVVKKAENAGMKGLFITVDAPQLGRRERDMRNKAEQQADVQGEQKEEVKKDQGTTRAGHPHLHGEGGGRQAGPQGDGGLRAVPRVEEREEGPRPSHPRDGEEAEQAPRRLHGGAHDPGKTRRKNC